jgi:hypothetical protein
MAHSPKYNAVMEWIPEEIGDGEVNVACVQTVCQGILSTMNELFINWWY